MMDVVIQMGMPISVTIMGCDCIFIVKNYSPNVESTVVDIQTNIEVGLHNKNIRIPDNQLIPNGEDDLAVAQMLKKAKEGSQICPTFEQLGGVDKIISQLKESVVDPIKNPELLQAYGLKQPKGVLLHGPPGTGKSTLARATAVDAGATLYNINGPELISEFLGESEKNLKAIFLAASRTKPSIIFIDEIDAIVGTREEGKQSESERMVTSFLTLMEALPKGVSVIGATNRPQQLDTALRRPGRFDHEIEVVALDGEGRLQMLIKKLNDSLSRDEMVHVSQSTHGFVAADMTALCDEACLCCLRRCIQKPNSKLIVDFSDFQISLSRVRPSSMRQVQLDIPTVSWSDIGGLHDIKQILKESVQWPQKMQRSLQQYGSSTPKGILLFGPPGCSKTLLAKAVAHEANLNFVSLKGGAAEVFSKFVGESEKAVAQLFSRARQVAPSIIFIDEIDAISGEQSNVVSQRVTSQLLIEMDGLMPSFGVVVLAATNCPQNIDKALLRPGRFDRTVYIPLPDTQTRKAILQVQLKNTQLSEDVDLDYIVQQCEGYTGADLAGLCRQACYAALEEFGNNTWSVSMSHFLAVLTNYQPNQIVDSQMNDLYLQFQRRVI